MSFAEEHYTNGTYPDLVVSERLVLVEIAWCMLLLTILVSTYSETVYSTI